MASPPSPPTPPFDRAGARASSYPGTPRRSPVLATLPSVNRIRCFLNLLHSQASGNSPFNLSATVVAAFIVLMTNVQSMYSCTNGIHVHRSVYSSRTKRALHVSTLSRTAWTAHKVTARWSSRLDPQRFGHPSPPQLSGLLRPREPR